MFGVTRDASPPNDVRCFVRKAIRHLEVAVATPQRIAEMVGRLSVFATAALDTLGLLGAVVIVLYLGFNIAHSPALESLLASVTGDAQAMHAPLAVLRFVAQSSLDSGSAWLSAVILAVALLGAAIDLVAGNFTRQLAVAVGVRVDTLEASSTEWDTAAGTAGGKGTAGGAAPPKIAVQNSAADQQAQQMTMATAQAGRVRPTGKVVRRT